MAAISKRERVKYDPIDIGQNYIKLTKLRLAQILGSKQRYSFLRSYGFCFFRSFSHCLGPLIFYLFGLLDQLESENLFTIETQS